VEEKWLRQGEKKRRWECAVGVEGHLRRVVVERQLKVNPERAGKMEKAPL